MSDVGFIFVSGYATCATFLWGTIELRHSETREKKYAERREEKLFFEVSVNGLCGAYTKHGLQVVPIKYKKGIILFDDLFVVTSTENGSLGVYDYKGRMVLPTEYEDISIQYGIIVGKKTDRNESKYYAYDRYGRSLFKELFNDKFDKGYDEIIVYDDCIVARENGLEELFTKEGSQIIAKRMRSINVGKSFIIAEDENGRFGVYDNDGKVILLHEFDEITRFGKYYIRARYKTMEVLFYKDGQVVIGRGKHQITETQEGAVVTTSDGTKKYFELRMHKAICM